MAVELAAGYATLTVKTAGVSKGLSGLFEGAQRQATGAGKKAGESYLRGLESELKTAEAQSKKFAEAQSKARDKEAEAAGRLRVATEKLNEAKRKGLADGGRLAQLEEAQASAKRKHASAATELARQTDAAAQAARRQAKAQSSIDAAPQTGTGFLGRLKSRFSADGAGVGRAFNESAAREVGGSSALGRAGEAAGGKLKGSMIAVLSKGAGIATAAVGIGTILSKGFERNIALDNAKQQMKSLGYEGEQLEAVMASALESVKGTAFGLGDAATLAGSALASGVKPGEELTKYLTTVADSAAFAQVPLGEMGEVLGKVVRQGKLTGDQIDSLTTRGLPIGEWIKQEFGSVENLSPDQLFGMLDKKLGGAAKDMGDTFEGSFQNLGASVGRLGEKITKPLFDLGKQAFPILTTGIDAVTNALGPFMSTIGEKLSGLFSGLDLGAMVGKVKELFSGGGDGAPLLETLKNVGSTLMDLGGTVFGAVTDALKSLGSHVMKVFNAMRAPIESIIATGKDTLLPVFQGLVGFFKENWPKVVAAFDALSPVVAKVAGLAGGVLATAFKVVASVLKFLFPIVAKVVSVLLSAAGAIIGALAPIADAVLGKLWPAMKTGWEGISTVIGTVWNAVKSYFGMWKTGIDAIGQGAMWLWNNAISPAWNGIKTAFGVAWDFVGGIIDKFVAGWEVLKTGVTGAATAIKTGITSAFSGLANIIKAPLRALGGFLANIPDTVLGISIPGAGTLKSWGQSLQGLAGGGVVRGPGTGTSDSVLAWLSNGEGVVTARAMGNGGGAVVAALNAGWTPSADYLRAMFMGIPGHAEGLNPGADYLRSMVMKLWPQISSIGGRRGEDGYGEHSSGNALDIMIPNYGSPEGVSLGNSVLAFLQKNGSALDVNGIIWRRTSYGYGGSLASGKDYGEHGNDTQNHMDHLHVILGKGRGAGAAPVSVPTMRLSAPSGSLGSGTLGGGGQKSAATQSKIATKQTRLGQLNADLAAAEQALAEAEANPKTKESTLMNKRNSVQKKKDAIAKAQSELDDLNNQLSMVGDDPGASGATGKSSGNDPFSKIIDGFSELGQAAMDGAVEGLLPPGFSNPMEWGILKAGGGLMKWIGGLTGDPVANAVLGTIGSGMTGDVQGAGSAIAGLFNPQQMLSGVAGDDMGGAFTDGMIDPGAGVPGGGTSVDNSVTINNAPYQDSTQQVMQNVQGRQMAKQRGHLGTKRIN